MRSARPGFVRPGLERLEQRVVLASGLLGGLSGAGTISGSVFDDRNSNGVRDAGEQAIAGVVVYLDANRNGRLDPGEKAVHTAPNGSYLFTGLTPGTYFVTQVPPAGWLPRATPIEVSVASQSPLSSSGADRLIGLDRFRADPRFAGIDGSGFSVAVLDTGIDADNPVFGPDSHQQGHADSILFQKDFLGGGSTANDTAGHGTEMASLVASRDPNHPGVAPGVNLIVLKVLGDGGGSFNTIGEALRWVVQNAAKYHIACVNLSLGDDGDYNHPVKLDGIDGDLGDLVAHGIVVVAAAGNGYHGKNSLPGLDYPAADPSVLPVGAVWDRDRGGNWVWSDDTRDYTTGPDRIVSFTQRLPGVGELMAPGTELATVTPGGMPTTVSGTSAASAVVSGLVALAQQLAQSTLGRMLKPSEIRDIFSRTGKSIRDGDRENDSVSHTHASFIRVDAFAMGQAILHLRVGKMSVAPGTGPPRVPTGPALAGINLALSCPMRVAGVTFRDGNGNGRLDSGEKPIAGATVFADANGNGRLDPGEQSVVSGTTGQFVLTGLTPGTYEIRQVVPAGWQGTTGKIQLVVAAGFNRSDLRLGSRQVASNRR